MKLAVYGAGGLGHEILELALLLQKQKIISFESVFFTADHPQEDHYKSFPVYDVRDIFETCGPSGLKFVIGVGEPSVRERLYHKVADRGYGFATLIHPWASVSPQASIGDGTVIQAWASVSVDTVIGKNCYLQACALTGHDCRIGDHCILSSHTAVSGNVTIGTNTYIAPGVMIKEKITIGDHTVAGMGAVVVRDLPENVIALGSPARPVKRKDNHNIF